MTQRLPFDERHHVVQQSTRLAGIVQREDVRVRQLTRDLNLSLETLGAERSGKVRVKHLDRHVAIHPHVTCGENRRHAAPTYLAIDIVAIAKGSFQAREELTQGCIWRGREWAEP